MNEERIFLYVNAFGNQPFVNQRPVEGAEEWAIQTNNAEMEEFIDYDTKLVPFYFHPNDIAGFIQIYYPFEDEFLECCQLIFKGGAEVVVSKTCAEVALMLSQYCDIRED